MRVEQAIASTEARNNQAKRLQTQHQKGKTVVSLCSDPSISVSEYLSLPTFARFHFELNRMRRHFSVAFKIDNANFTFASQPENILNFLLTNDFEFHHLPCCVLEHQYVFC